MKSNGKLIAGLLLMSFAMSAIDRPQPAPAQDTTPAVEPEKLDTTPVPPPPPPDSGSAIPESPASTTERAQDSPPNLAQFVHRITVGNHGGSCVSLGNGLYVTASHVVIHGQSPVVTIGGVRVRGEWKFAPAPHDFAVIQTGHITPGVPFSTDVHASGPVVAVGIPWTGEMRTCPATLTDSEHFSVSSGPGWESGMSGGGVFADGQLIGVGWGHGSGDPSAGWFTPLSAVAALLGRTPPASSAGPGEKPIVYVDVPAADWCPPCRALKPAYEAVKDSLEYQIVFRPVADDKRPNYPHVHVVDRSGNEQCAGALTAITDITAAWNRLHQ